MVRHLLVSILAAAAMSAHAQENDMDALLNAIDEKSGQFSQLTGILQGADTNRALAAFDVMLNTGDKSLRETAISTAMTATDVRLRARAFWEALSQKDSVTLQIDVNGLDDDARTALDQWVGPISTWSITARPENVQCLNLHGGGECSESYHLSVAGLRVEMLYSDRVQGGFFLTSEGQLAGEVTNPKTKAVYKATIELR